MPRSVLMPAGLGLRGAVRQDVGMTLEITVRGSAEQHHPAERAVVSLAVAREGADKKAVFEGSVAIQEPLTSQLRGLVDLHAVTTWSSDQVRVYSHRPWDSAGKRGDTVHVARVNVQAEFTDFERLSGFLDFWSGTEGVEVEGVTWDVTPKNRRTYEDEARKAAVDDAVSKAQSYANAVRRGKVVAQHLADPGMLTSQTDAPARMMVTSAVMDSRDGHPTLDLTPEHIVIHVDVDARFLAD
ncbi:SIMPL domain-containing protein [Aeromicrobium sp.]|uniref:SIMPL domain-containing protein n=1 Tax=Aeromicrobium sp. TaxID=1871063 RepID=UPI0019CB3EF5|nr:SIMPL domain-containing protein [Aeromicrobium sp.]MBC7630124.1 SIMPL domain-containing protein [Aeromicrobium sp.]